VAETMIAPNGNMVRLAPGPASIVDEAPSGRLHLDGQILVSEGDGFAHARRALGFAGFVGVTLVLDGKGRIATDPVLHMEGIPTQAREAIVDAVARASTGKRGGEELKEEVRRAARRAAQDVWGKKPVVRVETVEI
jgi:ribonuclease J